MKEKDIVSRSPGAGVRQRRAGEPRSADPEEQGCDDEGVAAPPNSGSRIELFFCRMFVSSL
jgi:hypothetical protein